MNERIKELAEQAGLNFGTNISGIELVYGTFEGSVISHIDSEELTKFAELIVQECVDTIQDHMSRGKRDDYYRGQSDSIELIKTHFGVKE